MQADATCSFGDGVAQKKWCSPGMCESIKIRSGAMHHTSTSTHTPTPIFDSVYPLGVVMEGGDREAAQTVYTCGADVVAVSPTTHASIVDPESRCACTDTNHAVPCLALQHAVVQCVLFGRLDDLQVLCVAAPPPTGVQLASVDNYAVRWAARLGHTHILRYLCEAHAAHGVDPHARDHHALLLAAGNLHRDAVRYLCEGQPRNGKPGVAGTPPLRAAAVRAAAYATERWARDNHEVERAHALVRYLARLHGRSEHRPLLVAPASAGARLQACNAQRDDSSTRGTARRAQRTTPEQAPRRDDEDHGSQEAAVSMVDAAFAREQSSRDNAGARMPLLLLVQGRRQGRFGVMATPASWRRRRSFRGLESARQARSFQLSH